MNYKLRLGDYGQKLASEFLSQRNYKILGEKFFTRDGELDLIAEQAGQLIFIEVKTRLSDKFGLPEEAIDRRKKEKMQQAGLNYLAEKQIKTDNYRFDCIAIEIDKRIRRQ